MTEHYVTLFDATFLPHGLALHQSMLRNAGDFHLWVVAMDEAARDALERLDLEHVTVLPLPEVENSALLSVKESRSRGEYCWTLTPFTPSIVFAADPAAQRVTYLDSDLWFVRDPAPLFAELEESGRSVLITDHAYAAEYDQSTLSGRFCVQFMPFVRDAGADVLTWWQDRVIEWCYARFEDGKFGDQKYLDDWPERFPAGVHVLEQESAMQAPWNAARFDPAEARIFHFHELRTMSADRVRLGHYRIPRATLDAIYAPYLSDLADGLDRLRRIGVVPAPQRPHRGIWPEVKDWLALRGLDPRTPRSPLTKGLPAAPRRAASTG
jgi:hypothetical protein